MMGGKIQNLKFFPGTLRRKWGGGKTPLTLWQHKTYPSPTGESQKTRSTGPGASGRSPGLVKKIGETVEGELIMEEE